MSAKTNQASILLTLEILPADAKGARRIIVSGAPADELPEVRAGLFAERHALVDDVYRAVMKRGPQTIKHAAPKADKAKSAADDDDEVATTDDGTEESPTNSVGASADATLENAIIAPQAEAKSTTTESEQTEQPTISPSDQQLPLIENDPTLANPQVQIAQEMDAEAAIAEAKYV